MHAHRRRNHTLAVVSSATRYQVEPLARDLGIEHVLCTRLEVRDGRFTGGVAPPLCYGEGKAEAARGLAASRGVDLDESFFYTDSDEDLPLLEHVGNPRPTNPNRRLAAIAARRGWPAGRFTSRGMPGRARRGAHVARGRQPGAVVPARAAGGRARGQLAAGRQPRGDDVGRARQRARRHRPAGHAARSISGRTGRRSSSSTTRAGSTCCILCKLLRRDFVGIAKQEIRRNPLFGPFFALAGTVFIDRSDHARAVHALEPAVQALREGLSIAIAPEGTRSTTRQARPVQEGRVPHGDGGPPADRADRHPQRPRRAAEARAHRAAGDHRRRGAPADRDRRLDGRDRSTSASPRCDRLYEETLQAWSS